MFIPWFTGCFFFFRGMHFQFKLLSTVGCNKSQTKYQPTSEPINTPLLQPGSCCSRSSWIPIVFEVVIRLPLILKWYTNPPGIERLEPFTQIEALVQI